MFYQLQLIVTLTEVTYAGIVERYCGGTAEMMVLELGDNISMVWDASLSIPPMIWMPVGESQDTWPHLVALSWWLVSHWPVKVEHVLSPPRPPQSVSQVAEW